MKGWGSCNPSTIDLALTLEFSASGTVGNKFLMFRKYPGHGLWSQYLQHAYSVSPDRHLFNSHMPNADFTEVSDKEI